MRSDETEALIIQAEYFGLQLQDSKLEMLGDYIRLMLEYNKNVNLTSITDYEQAVVKHVGDSLSVLRYVKIDSGMKLCDVGTGAGFPGAVLLIACDNVSVTLLDSTKKKLDFIKFALDKLGLKANILYDRAENVGKSAKYRESFDVVTGRAVASLPVLAEFCMPLVRVGGKFVAMKGNLTQEENTVGEKAVKAMGGCIVSRETFSLSNGDKRTLVISGKMKPTNEKYPREYSTILNNAFV